MSKKKIDKKSTHGSASDFSSLIKLIRYHASVRPDKVAIIFLADGEAEASRITYAELDRGARVMAARIQAGNHSGQNILLLLPSGIEYVVAFFGCLYANAFPVPVYPPTTTMHAERLSRIITDCDAKLVIAASKSLPSIRQKFEETAPGRFAAALMAVDEPSSVLASQWVEPDISRDALAYLQYTSGSTGDPCGVMVTHSNVLDHCQMWQDRMQQDDMDVYVSWLPFFHDMGLVMGIIQPIFIGATNVIMPPVAFVQKPVRWLAAMSKYRGTATHAPNFALERCASGIDDEFLEGLDLSSWKVVLNGAEPVRADTIAKFADRFSHYGFRPEAHRPGYGLAEATLVVSVGDKLTPPAICEIDLEALKKNRFIPLENEADKNRRSATYSAVSCGRALPGVEIVIADPASHRQCGNGMVGEIWVAGPTVTLGYWKRSEKTADTFNAHLTDGRGPFLRTGDLGYVHRDELYITGRLKDVVIIRGQNHYPQDIEHTTFQADPALEKDRGAAFSVEAEGEEKLVVVVEVRRTFRKKIDGAEIVRKIRAAIAERHGLEPYGVQLLNPASVHITSSGKIQRKACKADYLERRLGPLYEWHEGKVDNRLESGKAEKDSSSGVPDAKQQCLAITEWLVGTISRQKHLPVEQVLLDVPFSRFGLDSMELVAVSGDLSDWLGREVEPTLVYDYPDIGRLARHLSGDVPRQSESQQIAVNDAGETPMAIVGIACRLPGAASIEAYWDLLESGTNAISEVPASRWAVGDYYKAGSSSPGKMSTKWGGFIEHVDKFDAQFFGIAPREAESMDPQQRLLLEVTWHALEEAGIPPHSLAGSKTGVFIGISGNDYRQLQFEHHVGTDAYSGTGNALSVAANRISYFLDLRGPSWAVDTACSSSLVAVHQACTSLRAGECDLAIVGGVNLLLAPELSIVFSQAQMMASDGQCKTFDASADGYVRSEGCAVIILKRRADALLHNNSISCQIIGSAVNQDGKSNGLSAPNGPAQEAVVRQALSMAGVPPSRVSYVEAHGTGTSLGDPIEVNALKSVYGAPSSTDPALWIGSVKTNIGHTEALAGMAGLIKVALAMKHRKIPPHLHFRKINPNITLEGTRCAIPTSLQDWPQSAQPRIAGISSFGFGGTNSHVLIQEAPDGGNSSSAAYMPLADDAWNLLVLSSKSSAALNQLTQLYVDFLEESTSQLDEICCTASAYRSHHAFRLSLLSRSRGEARELLQRHLSGEEIGEINVGTGMQSISGNIAFMFTGQGSQYARMGSVLYKSHEGFRESIDRCDGVLQPLLGYSLRSILFGDCGVDLMQTSFAQPVIFALEYSLASVWKSCGVVPDYLIGHSLGEYVAACIAGVFSLEDGLKLVVHRGRLMQDQTEPGEMVALHAPEELIEQFLKSFKLYQQKHASVCVASRNSPQDIVLAGKKNEIEEVVAGLPNVGNGMTVTRVHVNRAFHSPLMQGMIAEFKRCAGEIVYDKPRIPVVSNITGKIARDEIASADYWVRHVLEPVLFAEGMRTLEACGCKVFVEIGPHPVLSVFGQQMVKDGIWLHSLRRGQDDGFQFQRSLGQWYAAGGLVDWRRWESERRGGTILPKPIQVPAYPFQSDRYWFRQGSGDGKLVRLLGSGSHPILGHKLDVAVPQSSYFENVLSIDRPWFISQHRVFNMPVLPAAAIIEWGLAAVSRNVVKPASGWVLENIEFRRAMVFDEERPTKVQLSIVEQDGVHHIRCFGRDADGFDSEWQAHAAMDARWLPTPVVGTAPSFDKLKMTMTPKSVESCYEYWRQRGLNYGPAFCGLSALWQDANQALAWIESPVPNDDAESYWAHPIVLDACFHALFAFLDTSDEDTAVLPIAIERFNAYRRLPSRIWCRIVWYGEIARGRFSADIELFDEGGMPVASIQGMQLAKVPRSALSLVAVDQMLEPYEAKWYPISLDKQQNKSETAGSLEAHWLVYCNDVNYAHQVKNELAALGYTALIVVADTTFKWMEEPSIVHIDPHSMSDVERLFTNLSLEGIQARGLLFLDGYDAPIDGESGVVESTYGLAKTSFNVIKQFLAAYASTAPEIVICTRGAAMIRREDGESGRISKLGLAQSVLTGMVKAVVAEFPQVKCVQVDLDPDAPLPPTESLWKAVTGLAGSGHIALRGNQWYEARLQAGAPLDLNVAATSIRADASYLITGGLGGIGYSIAEWLVKNGARSLILIGRGMPSNGTELTRSLESGGARVTFLQADIADADAWKKILPQIDHWQPAIKGIVHAAGVIDDGVINQLDWPRFEKVMAAKVQGSWNLHQFAVGHELDFLVYCSSIASLIGSAGQCNYILANAFLDGLAQYGRQIGMNATSINWGPWLEVGMAAQHETAARLAHIGIHGTAPSYGLNAFASVLAARPVQIGFATIDWPRYAAVMARKHPYTLLSEMKGVDQPAGHGAAATCIGKLGAEASKEEILEYLLERVVRVLRLDANRRSELKPSFIHQRLNQLGFDSLMAIELRNQILSDLAVDVPVHYFIAGSEVVEVVDLIHGQLMLKRLMVTEDEQKGTEMETWTL